jgi:hypothetical protein
MTHSCLWPDMLPSRLQAQETRSKSMPLAITMETYAPCGVGGATSSPVVLSVVTS